MEARDCSGTRRYGDVRIDWRCVAAADSCFVEVYWLDQLIMPAALNAGHRVRTFSVATETDPVLRVDGEFRYEPGPRRLVLAHLAYPSGSVRDDVLCPSEPPPPPPPPEPTPEPADDPVPVVETAGDLFPYVFLRGWPTLAPEERRDRFVDYPVACEPDDPRLICRLVTIIDADPDPRPALVAEAVRFIDGEAPWEHAFVRRPRELGPLVGRLWSFSRMLADSPPVDIEQFVALLVEHLGMSWTRIAEAVRAEPWALATDRGWQSLFALNIVLGYSRDDLADLVRTATMTRLLQRMVDSIPLPLDPPAEPEEAIPLPPAAIWTPVRIREGVLASVILPAPVFPLPPRQHQPGEAPVAPACEARVLPYAVGELRLVKRCLVGYEPGEIAHIENVMAGERKRMLERQRDSEHAVDHADDVATTSSDDSIAGVGRAFDQQVRETLREMFRVDYETTYGPPQEATQTGNWQLGPVGEDPTRSREGAESWLARQVTTAAARRVRRRLGSARLRESRHLREASVVRTVDRRGADSNTRGIYRWLNARYRCWDTRCGRRLMLEYFVPKPARSLIAARFDLAGVDLEEPVAPATLGLKTFEDVSTDPASTLYYAALAARYGVDDVVPPPPASARVGLVFQGGDPVTVRTADLPADYAAREAAISLSSTDDALTASGTIGAARFKVAASDAEPLRVALAGAGGALPVAFSLVAATGTSPAEYALAVDVHAVLAAERLDCWKSELYARLLAGYRRQREAFLRAAGELHPANASPDMYAWRVAVRGELRRAGLRAMFALAAARTGAIGRERRFAPALAVFLDRAFEWNEMSYAFQLDLETPDNERPVRRVAFGDDTFTSFLEAASARVLLPVRPGHEFTIAYFLASGMVWDADDRLAPTFDTPIVPPEDASRAAATWVDLADDLKRLDAGADTHDPKPAKDWFVVLPTAMTLLEHGDELPILGRGETS